MSAGWGTLVPGLKSQVLTPRTQDPGLIFQRHLNAARLRLGRWIPTCSPCAALSWRIIFTTCLDSWRSGTATTGRSRPPLSLIPWMGRRVGKLKPGLRLHWMPGSPKWITRSSTSSRHSKVATPRRNRSHGGPIRISKLMALPWSAFAFAKRPTTGRSAGVPREGPSVFISRIAEPHSLRQEEPSTHTSSDAKCCFETMDLPDP